MDVSRICSDLVAIRSEKTPGDTEAVIEYIRGLLEGFGLRSRVIGGEAGNCNLVCEGTRNLLFCRHVDVVPALDDG
jgi:acetylornithine deacetylase/succinyl-diaminopimelate desuccinylase-like protein